MLQSILSLLLLSVLVGCSTIMGTATSRMADNLSQAILNQNDPETVRAGAPAYLLLIDGLIEEDPNNISRLLTGAKLYSAYATIFVKDGERAQKMAAKALGFSRHAACRYKTAYCDLDSKPFNLFQTNIQKATEDDVVVLYALGSTWAGHVQINSSDWNAIADLPRITTIMQRIVELQEKHDHGGAHLYLGVLNSLRPASMGGKPEQGRLHFERSIEISEGRNLMAKVLFARYYARLVYNRGLHDRLLQEVLSADAAYPGMTLVNTLAQQEARALRDNADDYF